jgi:hypothetical protein
MLASDGEPPMIPLAHSPPSLVPFVLPAQLLHPARKLGGGRKWQPSQSVEILS